MKRMLTAKVLWFKPEAMAGLQGTFLPLLQRVRTSGQPMVMAEAAHGTLHVMDMQIAWLLC